MKWSRRAIERFPAARWEMLGHRKCGAVSRIERSEIHQRRLPSGGWRAERNNSGAEMTNVSDMTGAQSVDRALRLLSLVGQSSDRGTTLNELVDVGGYNKATTRRLLLALIRAGLVTQDEQERRYYLGQEAYILGTLAAPKFGLLEPSMDSLIRLSRKTGMPVSCPPGGSITRSACTVRKATIRSDRMCCKRGWNIRWASAQDRLPCWRR